MKRRTFIAGLGGAAAWPLAARAQQTSKPVIGFLHSGSSDEYSQLKLAFNQGLRSTGFIDGQNVTIEYRWANNRFDRLPGLAAELVQRQVALIFTGGSSAAALVARSASSTIPIVFQSGSDPVQIGLVTSLNRPGGNITGTSNLGVELEAKRLEMLHELLPTAATMAALLNPMVTTVEFQTTELQSAARTLGLQIQVLRASTEPELTAIFENLGRARASGLVVGTDGFFYGRRVQLAALSIQHAIPTIFPYREFAMAGGLMS